MYINAGKAVRAFCSHCLFLILAPESSGSHINPRVIFGFIVTSLLELVLLPASTDAGDCRHFTQSSLVRKSFTASVMISRWWSKQWVSPGTTTSLALA